MRQFKHSETNTRSFKKSFPQNILTEFLEIKYKCLLHKFFLKKSSLGYITQVNYPAKFVE